MNGLIAFYGVSNLESAREFYGEILGLKLYKDQGSCLIYHIPGGGCIGFCNHLTPVENPQDLYITIVTDEVDEFYNVLTEAGYTPTLEPRVNERFNIYQTKFIEPNGFTLEIQKFL